MRSFCLYTSLKLLKLCHKLDCHSVHITIDNIYLRTQVHKFDPIDEQRRKVYTLMPKTPVLHKKKKKHISYQEQLDEHSVSVKYVQCFIGLWLCMVNCHLGFFECVHVVYFIHCSGLHSLLGARWSVNLMRGYSMLADSSLLSWESPSGGH